jgi:hypothetical protein
MKPTSILLLCSLLALSAHGASPAILENRNGISYAGNVRTLVASGTLNENDHTVLVNAAAAVVEANLPAIRDRFMVLTIKKVDSTTNYVEVKPSGSNTIDGSTSYILTRQHQTITLQATPTGWLTLGPGAGLVRKVVLGAVRNDETNRAVTSANMAVAAYTIANQPDVPRNVTVSHTAVSTVDTLGTAVVVGTDYAGNALTETLTPVNGTIAAGTKAFRTVTSITGVGWVIAAGNDTVTFGYGSLIGLPVALPSATGTVLGTLDTTVAVKATTGTTLATSTVAEASGDASAVLTVYLDR